MCIVEPEWDLILTENEILKLEFRFYVHKWPEDDGVMDQHM